MKLFQPLTIKNMTLKNRLVLPALHLGMGIRGRKARAFYRERAKGGVGTIIMAGTSIDLFFDDDAWGRPGGADQLADALQSLTADIKDTGVKIGAQLWHGNQLPAGNGLYNKQAAQVAPSATDKLKELTESDIKTIIHRFATAARKAREAGLDFIELHGAHGYLLCQFFSPLDNRRQDQYGGDLNGRMQFGIELVKEVRKSVGDDFPIFYRLGALEHIPGGIELADSQLFAAELEKAGVDVLDISVGRSLRLGASPTAKSEMATFAPLAEAIRQKVTIPVIAVGRMNTGKIAESVLEKNQAELVAVGRQLIADPFWPQKVEEGREDEIVECESCNRCFGPIRNKKWRPGDRICKINDRAGRELD